jgi:hypothetical protein
MKLPYMQFYPGDWWREGGLRALDIADRGMWFEMLLTMHESPQRGRMVLPDGQPIPDESVARMIGLDTPRYREGLARLIKFGVAGVDSDGVVFCRRMIREEEKRVKDEENGMKGWEKRRNQPKAIPPPIPPSIKKQIPEGIPLSSEASLSSEDSIVPTSGTSTRRNRFVPPTAEEVRAYAKEIGFDIDAEKFVAHYNASGWKRGKQQTPITNWKGCVQTWRTNERSTPINARPAPGNYDHLPLGFTAAEKAKMERVARERAEDGLV